MPMETGKVAGDELVRRLEELDQGRYEKAIEAFEAEQAPVEGGLADLWRAEIACYLDRLDSAAGFANNLKTTLDPHLRSPDQLGCFARRRRLILAEILYSDGDYTNAWDLARPVAEYAETTGDTYAQMRAWYALGCISLRCSQLSSARRQLGIAGEIAREQGAHWFEGLIEYNQGILLYALGDVAGATHALTRALGLLRETENLRHTAICANFYAGLLGDLGRNEEALEVVSNLERVAVRLGIVSDMLQIGSNAAWMLMTLGLNAEAERRLVELLAWARSLADGRAELRALKMLATVQINQGRADEAELTAEEVSRLASSGGTAADCFDALLLVARARACAGREGAVTELRHFLARADLEGSDFHRAEARIYLAEALLGHAPVEAKAAAAEARQYQILATSGWLLKTLERIEHDLECAPIRFESEVTLVIDTSLNMPSLKQAREAVERFLFERAMETTNGNASAAGRLLGASPFQMHCLGRVLRGESPRPGRGEGPEAKRTYKRRRSRNLHQ